MTTQASPSESPATSPRPPADQPSASGSAVGGQQDWRTRLRGSRYGTPLVLLVTLVLVLGGVWVVNRPGEEAAPDTNGTGKISAVELTGAQSGPAPKVGEAAQDFTATTYDGTRVSLRSLRGRPVWLTFGASWCASCRAEFPDIQATHAGAAPKGLAVVGVYLSEDAATVKDYAERVGLTFAQIPDPRTQIASSYRVMGVPAHFFIDAEGVVRSMDLGILSHDMIKDRLTKIGA